MFRRRYYLNFKKKKIFLFLLHPYFTTMAFGPKFDILVSTVFPLDYGATDCTNDFQPLFPHFTSWILSFLAVSYRKFTPLHHYTSKYGCFYTYTFSGYPATLHIQIFFNQVSCVSITTLYVPLLLAIQKHANHFFVASCSCHPKLWQHSSSHNFYLAGRFAVSVSIQQLILQSSREYPYNEYELYSIIYGYIHHCAICDYCFRFFF